MKKLVLYFLLLTEITFSNAQLVYYSTVESLPGEDNRVVIGIFDLKTCSSKELYIDTTDHNVGYVEWIDIALSPDGKLFGLGQDGISEINLVSLSHTLIVPGPTPPNQRWRAGLECTKDNTLIFGERDLFTYDIQNQILDFKGRFLNPTTLWANIFWINGALMGSANNKIVSINLLNPANSQIYCNLPQTGFLSFFQLAIACDSVALFALHVSGDLYIVNPNDCSTTYYCTIPHTLDQTFQGTTPAYMFLPPEPCKISLDLDSTDSKLPGLNYSDTIFCSLPSLFLPPSLDIYSDYQWDSLVVWIDQGPLGISIIGDSPLFASISGNQSRKLKYHSILDSNFSDLSTFIEGLQLLGQIPEGITSLRIGFTAWASNLKSDTAYAYITLVGRKSTAGENNQIEFCSSDSPILFSSFLSDDASDDGIWIPNSVVPGYFSPSIDTSGQYLYLINDSICGPDTAFIILEPRPTPIFDLGPTKIICADDTAHFGIDLSNVSIHWNDGSNNSEIDILEPQLVSVVVTDEYGCNYYDSSRVVLDFNCIHENIFIPNIFSPNNDGINDKFIITDYNGIQNMELSIFDRWGNLVYVDFGKSVFWDGNTKNGEIAPLGVYVFKLKIVIDNYHHIFKSGNVTLIR